MAKKKQTKNSRRIFPRRGKLFILFLIFILVGLLVITLVKVNMPDQQNDVIFSYADCIHSSKRTLLSTYPKQCITSDHITWIENIALPIDTASWKRVTTNKGISYLCPPTWKCTDDIIDGNGYGGISLIQFRLITTDNFQKSILRNPNYSIPLSWYQDFLLGKTTATKAPISTRIYSTGTESYSDPAYTEYDLSNITNIRLENGQGKLFEEKAMGDTNLLIPVNSTDLCIIILPGNNIHKDPIISTILKSIIILNR